MDWFLYNGDIRQERREKRLWYDDDYVAFILSSQAEFPTIYFITF